MQAFVIAVALSLVSATAVAWVYAQGYTLYFGDAEAHLNIARRILDSRTPGPDQIGTVWLPLPHLAMLPFVGSQFLWQSGIAGSIPGAAFFVLGGTFFFAALRRLFQSAAPAVCGTALLALNPNLLYLQAIPMTEAYLMASLCALLYFTVLFRQTQSRFAVLGAAGASCAASLTRYEGWFLIPFAAVYFLIAAERRRLSVALVFALVAALAPLSWLGHNWWYYGDPLEFYHGQYSAKAIYERALAQNMSRYPGDGDWKLAWFYFRSAAGVCAGMGLVVLAAVGVLGAAWRRTVWPVVLLALPPVFYVLSMQSSGTPIFLPHLWPNSYYNTRYGLSALPLLAFLGAALVALVPPRFRDWAAAVAVVIGVAPWAAYPRPESWICWKESQVNSVARRAWTAETASVLKRVYRPGDGMFTSSGDLMGIYRQSGIPLHETLNDGNNPAFLATLARPDLHLREEWAIAIAGDSVATAMLRLRRNGPNYEMVRTITVKGAPPIEIYRRSRKPPPLQ
jgi:hypothetical protein